MVIFTRNTDSGVREVIQNIVLGKEALFPENATVKHDKVMLKSISKIPTAIDFASLGELDDSIKTVIIEGITSSLKTVQDGSYPIARTLTLATKGSPIVRCTSLY